jgi:hypothetical protein
MKLNWKNRQQALLVSAGIGLSILVGSSFLKSTFFYHNYLKQT